MRALFAGLMGFWLSLGGTAAQAQGPVVVELFTSQGCSNCPPVDALLGELAMQGDVIALGLHVDYWDYIGWPDEFANPAFTARQHGYARASGSTVVYTPQLVINGTSRVVGNQPMNVFSEIMTEAETVDPVRLDVSAAEGGFEVRFQLAGGVPEAGMVVQLVSYTPHQRVVIGRGENANRVIDYYNIVRSWDVVAEWDGMSPLAMTVLPQADLPHVVIVQEAGFGAILGAAHLR